MAYTDLLAGRLDATLTAITAALPHIQSGKLRVLGVASAEPSEIYPQAPTLRSQGLPNVVASGRSEEHTSELQSLMRISYAVFCLKKKKIYIMLITYIFYSISE